MGPECGSCTPDPPAPSAPHSIPPALDAAEKRIGGARGTRYNSPIVRTPRIILATLCLALACSAQGAPDAVQDFAARIDALAGPGTATLTVKNLSSADSEQLARFRKALQGRLNDAGVRLRQPPQSTSEIRVTLSENAHGLVYLAEVQQGEDVRVAIVEAPRVAVMAAGASAMSLRRSLLVSRAEPVLDAALLRAGGQAGLAVLTAQAVVLYRQRDGGWSEESNVPITHGPSFPLDLRGRLVPAGEGLLDAYLPATVCSITATGALRAECHDADDAWPLGAQAAFFNSARNYFNGLLRPGFGKPLAPFFQPRRFPTPDIRFGSLPVWMARFAPTTECARASSECATGAATWLRCTLDVAAATSCWLPARPMRAATIRCGRTNWWSASRNLPCPQWTLPEP